MKVFFMNGGLGNQLYQYIFMRWMEEKTHDECIIDDSAFFLPNTPHNGYEIERIFGLKPRRLSQILDAEVWQEMLAHRDAGITVAQQLKSVNQNLAMVYESGVTEFAGPIIGTETKNMSLCHSFGDIYFHGYWMVDAYFNEIEAIMRQELTFPAVKNLRNKMYENLIKSTNSIAVHVRRGDMVALGWSKDAEYFRMGLTMMEEHIDNAHYFVFSDDLPWCKENRGELGLNNVRGAVTFIDGNRGENAYVDLQLMAMCKHDIISRSSFSLLASMLNTNPDKIVYFK